MIGGGGVLGGEVEEASREIYNVYQHLARLRIDCIIASGGFVVSDIVSTCYYVFSSVSHVVGPFCTLCDLQE